MDASFERDISDIPSKNYYTRVPHCMKRHVQMSPGHVYSKGAMDLVHTSF